MVVKTPERDLSLLLAAVHEPPGPTPDVLVRYADDPDSLSEAERAEVEDALSDDPLLAGELRALASERAAAPLGAAETPGRIRWLPRRMNPCIIGPLIAVAAAALLALVWLPGLAPAPAPLVRVSSPAAADPAPVAPPAPEPTTTLAAASTEARAEQVPAPEAPSAAEVEGPRPSPRTPESSAPATPAAEAPASDLPTAPPEPSEPVLLAVLEPQYRPPAEARARYRIDGAIRAPGGQREVADLELLAPAHVALTHSPAPSLFWTLAALPAEPVAFSLTLSAAMTPEPLLERPLPRPDRAGLQRIPLARYGVELEPGVEYIWTISADLDGDVAVAQGWIQRAESELELPPVSPGERPAQYAAAGLWYDAVEALADLADQHPDEERIASALRTLAAQARIEPN